MKSKPNIETGTPSMHAQRVRRHRTREAYFMLLILMPKLYRVLSWLSDDDLRGAAAISSEPVQRVLLAR